MPSSLDGPTNGRRFRSYVTETLIPVRHPGDIVVMDNLPAHRVAGVREAIEAARSATALPSVLQTWF